MDGAEGDSASSEQNTMTEGTTVLTSNGQAGRKDKKVQKSKSRFGRRAKSAEKDTRPGTPTESTPGMLESEITAVAPPSRDNSQKRHIGRLFRRSSPSVKRSRSLSGTRGHKQRSKSSEHYKADSVVVVAGSDVEVSYRTFDPHKKPRGRLRKMTVHEAREEQKQRLLDSVNQLPIFAGKADEIVDTANFGPFRSRSGTSSSMPDIRKCREAENEGIVEGGNDNTRSEKSSYAPPNESNRSSKSPASDKAMKTTEKGSEKSDHPSPKRRPNRGNNNHSGKTSQKSEKDKNSTRNKNDKRRFGLNNKKSKQKTSTRQRYSDVQKFQDKGEKVDGNVDVTERRKRSRATFLALSKSPSLDSASEDICDDKDYVSNVRRGIADVPSPSKSEPPRCRWDDIDGTRSPTETYKSPRSFGRSESSQGVGRRPQDTIFPKGDELLKLHRSESGHRKKGSTKRSESRPNSPSPGKNESGKYMRTFSPTRKQNEDDISAVNAGPVASTNKSNTECNESHSAKAEIVRSMPDSPVGRINCAGEKSAKSCPNSTTLPHGAPKEDLKTNRASPQPNCCETTQVNAFQAKTTSNWDKIKCKAVIETAGDSDNVECDLVEESAASGSSAIATLSPFTRTPESAGDRNRFSPEPRSSQSEEEELFYDAKNVLSDGSEQRKSSERLTPVHGTSGQQRGSLVTADIPCIEAAPDSSRTEAGIVEEPTKSSKLSIRALVLVKRLSRRSKSLKVKKKPQKQRSSLPDVRIEDYDDRDKRDDSHEKEFVVIENECGKSGNLDPFPFGGNSPVIDNKDILKKELQFEPVASDEPLPEEDDRPPNLPDLARRRESKYQRLEERRREIVTCCKQFIAVLFSHIGLISSVVVYAIAGGFLFQYIEGPNEIKHQNEIRQFRAKIVMNLLDNAVLVQTNMLEKSNFTDNAEQLLKSFQTEIYVATKEKGWDGKDDSVESVKQWSFASSLLYAITVMTTIGYGHVAPITNQGRLITIAYAVIGIPLTLLCLTNMGDLMAKGFRFLYAKVCCDLCCRPFRLRPRLRRPDPEKGECHVMSDKKEYVKEEVQVPTLLCVFMIVGYIFAGAFLFSLWENWNYVTGSYFCFITLSTIGFGDIVPGMDMQSWSKQEKLALCTLYLVVGLAMLAMCFTLVQEDVKAKCRWLGQKIGILERNEK